MSYFLMFAFGNTRIEEGLDGTINKQNKNQNKMTIYSPPANFLV